MKQLTSQEKGLICRALIKSNPEIIEILGKTDGTRGLWQPFVDALAQILGAKSAPIILLFLFIGITGKAQENKDFQKLNATQVCRVFYPVGHIDTTPAILDSLPVTDSIKIIDSLKTALVLAQYNLRYVKHFLDITNKNPKKSIYLRSWLNRIFY